MGQLRVVRLTLSPLVAAALAAEGHQKLGKPPARHPTQALVRALGLTSMDDLHMLKYWIGDKGIETALDDYYPNLAASDPKLAALYAQYLTAKESLLSYVNKLAEHEADI